MGCIIYLVPLSTTPFTPNSLIHSVSLQCHFDVILTPYDIINSASLHQTLLFDGVGLTLMVLKALEIETAREVVAPDV